MKRKISVDIPPWAISEAEIAGINLPKGFLRDFVDYVNFCSDAPSSFALATGFGILAVASGKCNIVVQGDGGLSQTLPIRLWQALVGNSGQRKSKVMDLGLGVLQRTGQDFLLPGDASIEAWHDSIAENPICMLHQEELSGLFDAQMRNYSLGLQSFLLSMWQGTPKSRRTKAGGTVEIQRPRLNLFGAIPPDVFFRKTKNLDWKSGFLPRFLFWGGVREHWQSTGVGAPRQEEILAFNLQNVHLKSEGDVIIPYPCLHRLSSWYFENVECHAHELLEDTYSGLLRLQEAGLTLAALIALSQRDKPVRLGQSNRLTVSDDDISSTIEILNLSKRIIASISSRANKTERSLGEQAALDILNRSPSGCTISELADKLNVSLSLSRNLLEELVKSGLIRSSLRKKSTGGRPAMIFEIVPK